MTPRACLSHPTSRQPTCILSLICLVPGYGFVPLWRHDYAILCQKNSSRVHSCGDIQTLGALPAPCVNAHRCMFAGRAPNFHQILKPSKAGGEKLLYSHQVLLSCPPCPHLQDGPTAVSPWSRGRALEPGCGSHLMGVHTDGAKGSSKKNLKIPHQPNRTKVKVKQLPLI